MNYRTPDPTPRTIVYTMRVCTMKGYDEEIRCDENGWRTVVRLNYRGCPKKYTERVCYSPYAVGPAPKLGNERYYLVPKWVRAALEPDELSERGYV